MSEDCLRVPNVRLNMEFGHVIYWTNFGFDTIYYFRNLVLFLLNAILEKAF